MPGPSVPALHNRARGAKDEDVMAGVGQGLTLVHVSSST